MAKRIEGVVYDKKALDLVKKGLGFAKIKGVRVTDNGDGTFNVVAYDTVKELQSA
jgi:hypothetical protein